jgi:hypothetical protein
MSNRIISRKNFLSNAIARASRTNTLHPRPQRPIVPQGAKRSAEDKKKFLKKQFVKAYLALSFKVSKMFCSAAPFRAALISI